MYGGLVTKSCPTLAKPWTIALPGSSVYGILQAGILEWVAISFSRWSSQSRNQLRSPALQADSLPTELQGKLLTLYSKKQKQGIEFTFQKYLNIISLTKIIDIKQLENNSEIIYKWSESVSR